MNRPTSENFLSNFQFFLFFFDFQFQSPAQSRLLDLSAVTNRVNMYPALSLFSFANTTLVQFRSVPLSPDGRGKKRERKTVLSVAAGNAINYVSIFPDLAFCLFHNFGTNSLRFLKTIRSRRSKVQVTHQRLMTLLADFDWLPDETPFPIQCCGQLHFLHQAFYRFEHLSTRYAMRRRRSRGRRIFFHRPPHIAHSVISRL